MSRVRVAWDDSPIHCVDVLNGLGERVMRIRPHKSGGIAFYGDFPAVVLNLAELQDLAQAFSRLETQQTRRTSVTQVAVIEAIRDYEKQTGNPV